MQLSWQALLCILPNACNSMFSTHYSNAIYCCTIVQLCTAQYSTAQHSIVRGAGLTELTGHRVCTKNQRQCREEVMQRGGRKEGSEGGREGGREEGSEGESEGGRGGGRLGKIWRILNIELPLAMTTWWREKHVTCRQTNNQQTNSKQKQGRIEADAVCRWAGVTLHLVASGKNNMLRPVVLRSVAPGKNDIARFSHVATGKNSSMQRVFSHVYTGKISSLQGTAACFPSQNRSYLRH